MTGGPTTASRSRSRTCDDDAVKRAADWLREVRPQLVIGNFVFEAAQRLGWRIPEDVALATFDRPPEFRDHAGLDQRHDHVGGLAADVLIAEITHNRRGIPDEPVQHTIQGVWVNGPSAPRRR